MSNQIEFINIDNIFLDKENPRLPEFFRDKENEEKDIINWMLEDASIIELMLAIGQNGFFVGEAVLVVRNNDKTKCTVIEGNRRVSSVKLLNNPDLAEVHTRKVSKVLEEAKIIQKEIPCIVFDNRDEISQYLGYRHVTGIKPWSLLSKARYLSELAEKMDQEHAIIYRELAKKIGSRSDYIKRLLVGFTIFEKIKDSGYYKIPSLDETTFHFNYIADSLRHENIREFLSLNMTDDDPFENFNDDQLKLLIDWFFRKNEQGRPRVYGTSKDLTSLNSILANKEAIAQFIDGTPLNDALKYTAVNADSFHHELEESLRSLKYAHSFIHQIYEHNGGDIEVLTELNSLSKIMRNTIIEKNDDA